jgi:hypothetical protein
VKNDGTVEMRRGIGSTRPSPLPAVIREGPVEMGDKAKSLTEALFSLEEPWQGRFLDLVAKLATRWAWGGQRPTREEVVSWLSVDPSLCREVKRLLDAWQPGR